MNDNDTLAQLRVVVLDIDHAIAGIMKKVDGDSYLKLDNPYMLMDTNGRYILLDTLAAKANALAAIARLESRE